MADEEIPSSHPRVPAYPLAHEGGDALSGQQLLRLSRSDRQAARDRLRTLTPAQQARACMDLRPARRAASPNIARSCSAKTPSPRIRE